MQGQEQIDILKETILALIPRVVKTQGKIISQHQNLFTETNAEKVATLLSNDFVTFLVNKIELYENVLDTQSKIVHYKDKLTYINSLFGPEEVVPEMNSTYENLLKTIENVPNKDIAFE